MTDRSPGRCPRRPTRSTAWLFFVLLGLTVGCSGGSTSSLVPVTPTPPPVIEIDRAYGNAGDIFRIRATGIDSDPANLEVSFLSFSGLIRLRAPILDVSADGTQTGHGTIWSVRCRVPGGARSGSVSIFSNGVSFGAFGFDAGPEVIGALVGNTGELGAVTRDPTGSQFPSSVFLYGYNLTGVTEVEIDQEGDGSFDFFASATGLGGVPSPPNTDVLEVELPNGLNLLACETESLRFVCRSFINPGVQLPSGPVDVPFGSIPLGGLLSDAEIPGYFTGARVPIGVRSGDVTIEYALLMDPAGARFELVAEYLDPADLTGTVWLPCTPAPQSPAGDRLPGDREVSPGGQLVGLGAHHRFVWDTLADLVGITGSVATRVRLRLADPVPAIAVPCPTGEWVTPRLVIDNDAPTSGEIIEEFVDTDFFDPLGGGAIWSFGELIAPVGGGNPTPAWGTGTIHIAFLDGETYRFDTTARTLLDVTIPGSPIDLLPINPGAVFGEFHLGSLTVAPTAVVEVVGDFPLVIRCAGDGTDAFLALDLQGDIILDGSAGAPGTNTDPGAGGAGAPGGSDGGDGARIEIDATANEVLSIDDATAGENGGGEPGQSTVFVVSPAAGNSLPRAGCGGGGGGATPGEAGVNTFDATTSPIADSGRGGAARGDDALTIEVGGAGGGGGGACAIRVGASGLLEKHGGGGGGGGGALEIAVRGRAELRGQLSARGGDGAPGSSGSQPGAGGGGGGGSLAVRTTGFLEVFDTARLEVPGGLGGITVSGTNVQRGGDGTEGRVRLETNSGLLFETILPADLTIGVLTSGNFERAGRNVSRARSLGYPRVSSDGVTVGSPTTYGTPVITPGVMGPPTGTSVVALYEGAPSDPADPSMPGTFTGLVGDPALLGDAEYIRVRWFLYSDPGLRAVVDSWELPFTNP